MAERKAQNKYYPPNFDWKIHGSINKMKGQHPLRQRAKKIGEGILTIRFELPFNCWCTGCEKHIGIGVRYNAQKQKIGMYFTTPIWSFKMKCHLCPNRIQINTDPQSGTYKIIEGLRLREESYDPKSIGVIELQDEEETKKLENDPFYKLEHGVVDEIKATTAAPKLHEIQSFNDQYWKDPYTLSQLVRKKFRVQIFIVNINHFLV
ncbi:CWC16 protein [Globomyces pollinis-pini]|nr:CWC16 protein [Globomyces pollinis-pini]